MMDFIKKVIRFFSRFTDDTEKLCYQFFINLSPKSDHKTASERAKNILQKNTPRALMILEWKFKGYTQLTKGYRKKCYEDLLILTKDFEDFYQEKNIDSEEKFLKIISDYLHKHRPIEYKAGASFDKLLKNPKEKKLIGDCNQITSLYIYFFSLKYDISTLKLKLLPGHVCLHHEGTDYETTTGQISVYKEFERLAPIEEIIAVNILDTSDYSENQHPLPPENRLQCAELAIVFSGNKELAQQNLDAAYHNLAIHEMNRNHFKQAAKWAEKTEDKALLDVILHNEAVYELNHKHYDKARRIFKRLHDKAGAKAVDQKELNSLLEKLKGCKTTQDYKNKRTVIYKIKKLALTLHDREIQKFCENILKQI